MSDGAVAGSVRPGGWLESLLVFGLPGLLLLFTFEWLNPWLQRQGMALVWSFTLSLYLPLLLLGFAAAVGYHREGNAANWTAFRDRMRLGKLPKRAWWWISGGLVAALVLEGLLEPTSELLASIAILEPPPSLPALIDPAQPLKLPPTTYLGEMLAGNPWLIALYGASLFANIIGEELLWRGYLLPRQERVFGRWAWLVNGLLWVFVFHLMMRWMWVTLLPTGLIAPFVAQHTQNTWTAIAIHGMGNAIFLGLLALGVILH